MKTPVQRSTAAASEFLDQLLKHETDSDKIRDALLSTLSTADLAAHPVDAFQLHRKVLGFEERHPDLFKMMYLLISLKLKHGVSGLDIYRSLRAYVQKRCALDLPDSDRILGTNVVPI